MQNSFVVYAFNNTEHWISTSRALHFLWYKIHVMTVEQHSLFYLRNGEINKSFVLSDLGQKSKGQLKFFRTFMQHPVYCSLLHSEKKTSDSKCVLANFLAYIKVYRYVNPMSNSVPSLYLPRHYDNLSTERGVYSGT